MTISEWEGDGSARKRWLMPNVYEDPRGVMVCNVHTNAAWCDCINEVLRTDADALRVYRPHPVKTWERLDDLVVPVWGWKKSQPYLEVGVHVDGRGSVSPVENANNVLGFVEPTEGRRVIRLMLVEWLASLHRTIKCSSLYHGDQAPTTQAELLRRADPMNPTNQLETFVLVMTGECQVCADPGIPEL